MSVSFRIFVFLLPALCSSVFIYAQDLIIEYDYVSEMKKYYLVTKKKTKQINRPRVGQYGNIILKSTNFNSFALTHKPATEYYQEINEGGGSESEMQFESSFNSLFGSTLDFSSMFTGSMSKLQGAGEEGDGSFGFANGEGGALYDIESEINQNIDGLLAIQNKLDEILLAEKRIKQLKYNVNIPADRIKARADSLMRNLISAPPTANEAMRFAGALRSDLSSHYAALENSYPVYIAMIEQPKNTNEGFGFAATQVVASRKNLYQDNLKMAQAIVDSAAKLDIAGSVQEIYASYEEIMDNDFAYNYSTTSEDNDFLKINVNHYLREELSPADTAEMIKTTHFAVPVRSGLKINSSIGFAFSRFFDEQQEFAIRDTAIVATKGDAFTPIVSALINFYPQTGKRVSLGGSFGIGVPITGTFSLNFLLGPSLVMGGKQKIILFGGVSAGKVERLAEGLNEGEVFASPYERIPTTSRYEFGYFAGISYSFSKLELK